MVSFIGEIQEKQSLNVMTNTVQHKVMKLSITKNILNHSVAPSPSLCKDLSSLRACCGTLKQPSSSNQNKGDTKSGEWWEHEKWAAIASKSIWLGKYSHWASDNRSFSQLKSHPFCPYIKEVLCTSNFKCFWVTGTNISIILADKNKQ